MSNEIYIQLIPKHVFLVISKSMQTNLLVWYMNNSDFNDILFHS